MEKNEKEVINEIKLLSDYEFNTYMDRLHRTLIGNVSENLIKIIINKLTESR